MKFVSYRSPRSVRQILCFEDYIEDGISKVIYMFYSVYLMMGWRPKILDYIRGWIVVVRAGQVFVRYVELPIPRNGILGLLGTFQPLFIPFQPPLSASLAPALSCTFRARIVPFRGMAASRSRRGATAVVFLGYFPCF